MTEPNYNVLRETVCGTTEEALKHLDEVVALLRATDDLNKRIYEVVYKVSVILARTQKDLRIDKKGEI
jgi:hypothetical protein